MTGKAVPGRPATGFRPQPGPPPAAGPGAGPAAGPGAGPAAGPGADPAGAAAAAPDPRPAGAGFPRPDPAHQETEELWAMLSYLGAIFVGPFAPLAIFLARRHRSPYIRVHAAQALNVSLTCTLFAVSALIAGGLLALDSPAAALIVMLPIVTAGWAVMLVQLVRGGLAASHGDFREMPRWICSAFVH